MEKPTKEQIEKARANLKRELSGELSELKTIKAEEELRALLKSKMEKRYATPPLPPSREEIREKEREEMLADYEKELKERDRDFDEQMERKKPKEGPGFEYS